MISSAYPVDSGVGLIGTWKEVYDELKRHAMMKAATTTMMVTEINLTEWGPLLLIRGHTCTMFNFGRRGRGGVS